METKDWILLLVPILLEGIIIFLVQAHFNRRFARLEKKLAIKDDVILTFLKMVMDVALEYQHTFCAGTSSQEQVQDFLDLVKNTGLYYEAYTEDLQKVSSEFVLFYNTWLEFVTLWNNHTGQEYGSVAKELGDKLDVCKNNTDSLMRSLRDKAF